MSTFFIHFTQGFSPRLEYTCNFIFNDYFKTGYRIVSSMDDIPDGSAVINYTPVRMKETFNLQPSGLLSESTIIDFNVETTIDGDCPYLFPSNYGDFPADIFSGIFYLLSRYEEYIPFEADKFGRFTSDKSILSRLGHLEIPLINRWLVAFAKKINSFYRTSLSSPVPVFLPTIDIDNPWAYLHKPVFRQIAGLLKDTFWGNFRSLSSRLGTYLKFRKDPYDSYSFIFSNHGRELKLFILASNKSIHDARHSLKSNAWKNLVRKISAKYDTGLHPGLAGKHKFALWMEEKELLNSVLNYEINFSRQHFLVLQFPGTYRKLISLGMIEDFSMGYADKPGFRAGTSNSFLFYDLEKDEETSLRIYPFCLMDRTLKDYMNLSPEDAIQKVESIARTVSYYGGYFSTIWHNESLGSAEEWAGWQKVYQSVLDKREWFTNGEKS